MHGKALTSTTLIIPSLFYYKSRSVISKDVFDVYGSKSGHNQFKNDASGFKFFLKSLPKESLVVMEATGYYYQGKLILLNSVISLNSLCPKRL